MNIVLIMNDKVIERIPVTPLVHRRCHELINTYRTNILPTGDIVLDVSDYIIPTNSTIGSMIRRRRPKILLGEEEEQEFIDHYDLLTLVGSNPPTVVDSFEKFIEQEQQGVLNVSQDVDIVVARTHKYTIIDSATDLDMLHVKSNSLDRLVLPDGVRKIDLLAQTVNISGGAGVTELRLDMYRTDVQPVVPLLVPEDTRTLVACIVSGISGITNGNSLTSLSLECNDIVGNFHVQDNIMYVWLGNNKNMTSVSGCRDVVKYAAPNSGLTGIVELPVNATDVNLCSNKHMTGLKALGTSVTRLDIYDSSIHSTVASPLDIPGLMYLNMGYCTQVECLSKCTKLKVLRLRKSDIGYFGAFQIPDAHTVHLRGCRMASITWGPATQKLYIVSCNGLHGELVIPYDMEFLYITSCSGITSIKVMSHIDTIDVHSTRSHRVSLNLIGSVDTLHMN